MGALSIGRSRSIATPWNYFLWRTSCLRVRAGILFRRLGGACPGQMMSRRLQRQSIVYVVDDDAPMRCALKDLLESMGIQVSVFGSTMEFLTRTLPDIPSCLVLDVRLPGMSGLDLQAELAKASIQIPIIFISGHGDIPMTVRAMKAGAIEFLVKPIREQDLLDAVQIGIDRDQARLEAEEAKSGLQVRYLTLTPREREVISFVTAGLMNKQIAAEMGVSEISVKVHRGNLMRKMGAKSLAELVRMADLLGIRRPNSTPNKGV
jgi:FixJ family two-component response regulator